MRCNQNGIEFPLTMGRDFVGTVVYKGMQIDNSEYKIGDKVFGVVPVHKQGCHCEYIVSDKCHVAKKPENISDADAAAILYAGLTAYSGIFLSGELCKLSGLLCDSVQKGGAGKKVLVLGASGGVGHLAVQILQAEGAEVIATCGQDAVSFLNSLGVSKVIDYTSSESDSTIISESPYDLILDCAGKGAEYANQLPWVFNNYVTFKSPLLKNMDENGLIAGNVNSLKQLITQNITALNGKGMVKWGYFMPFKNGISYLKKLAEQNQLLPVIDSKYNYDKLPEAYAKVKDGHLRGKVVIEF
jgi:NADPH:quinone reductase-like Zn-dependent oxidoreductase